MVPYTVFEHVIEIPDSTDYEAIISQLEARIAELEAQVTLYEEEQATVQANIERFDYLDFVSFNEQDWGVFSELHHPDVLVGYSDGKMTTNIGSSATVVGNPVGVLIAMRAELTFMEFLRWTNTNFHCRIRCCNSIVFIVL